MKEIVSRFITSDQEYFLTAEEGGAPEGQTVGISQRQVARHRFVAVTRPAGLITTRQKDGPLGSWQDFTVRLASDGKVGFRADRGFWMSAQPDGTLVANRQKPDDFDPAAWEAFTPVKMGDNAWAFQSAHGKFIRVEGGGKGPVKADADVAGPWETLTADLSQLFKPARPPMVFLRPDGRFLLQGEQTFRPLFASFLSACGVPDEQVIAGMDELQALGFNGFRVFAGDLGFANGQTPASARARLPFVLEQALGRDLMVEVTAITGSATNFDVVEHIAEINKILVNYPNALLELANEPYHPTQSERVHDPSYLRTLAELVDPKLLYAFGAAEEDESDMMAGGEYVTVHLDRGRDKWNMARRVRELAALSENTKKFVMDNEPIGAADASDPGKRERDPAVFFTLGALDRLFEVGSVFHSDNGLHCLPLSEHVRACAEAHLAGHRAIDTEDRLAFMNAGWAGSPVVKGNFDQLIRAYSGVAGNAGYTVVVGHTDAGLGTVEFGNGWQNGETLATMHGTDDRSTTILRISR